MEPQNATTFNPRGAKLQSLPMLLVPIGIALNLAMGLIVNTLKLPVYLDAVGTIIVTLLVGLRAGIITGVGSFLLGGILTNPVLPWFSGTQIVIAAYVHLIAKRGGYRTLFGRIGFGLLLGVAAGLASAPVIVYLFGGITGSGASLLVGYLMATGKKLIESVFLSGLAAEPLDKTLQTLLAWHLLRGLPQDLLGRFNRATLVQNGILK